MPWIRDDSASFMTAVVNNPEAWLDRNLMAHSISGMGITHLEAAIQFLRNGNYAYGQGYKLPLLEAELVRRSRAELPEVIDYFKEHLK